MGMEKIYLLLDHFKGEPEPITWQNDKLLRQLQIFSTRRSYGILP